MSKKPRPTHADYEEMAASYAAEPVRPEEIRSVTAGPGLLRMGRPAKGITSTGKSPALSTRYPAELREQLTTQAETEGITESELVRKAVSEYIGRRVFVSYSTEADPHVAKILGMCLSEPRAKVVHATRVALEQVALHHTGFELKTTANPSIVETNGTLDLENFVDYIVSR